MKKLLPIAFILMLFFCFSGIASAALLEATWEDYDWIGDRVGISGMWYNDLNIAIADDFRPGKDIVKHASLYLTLDDDSSNDPSEHVWVWTEGTGWTYVDEVSTTTTLYGPYSITGGGLEMINQTGGIEVFLDVSDRAGRNDVDWDSAKLVAKGYASVPEPGSILLVGLGLVGLAGFRRKFRK